MPFSSVKIHFAEKSYCRGIYMLPTWFEAFKLMQVLVCFEILKLDVVHQNQQKMNRTNDVVLSARRPMNWIRGNENLLLNALFHAH